jgi:hypothetical protein
MCHVSVLWQRRRRKFAYLLVDLKNFIKRKKEGRKPKKISQKEEEI